MTVAHRFRPGTLPTRPWARSVAALAVVVTCSACRVDDAVAVPQAPRLTRSAASAGSVIQGQYIVVLNDSVTDVDGATAKILRAANATVGHTYGRALKGFSATMSEQAANALVGNPAVAFVEADRLVAANDIQSDAPWATDRIDQRTMPLSNTYAWTNTGSGVNVYILDSGIRTGHEQFGGRARSVYGAFGDGWDSADCNGHGTYVAGLAGSDQYGSAKLPSLLSVRVLDCSANGTTTGVIAGLDWLAANRLLPAVANMSFGLPYSAALNQAVQNVINAGVTVTASAGNNGLDACLYSPASVPGAITVGGSTGMDAMASWSNRGTCVDLFAPATNVFSTSNSSDLYSSVTVATGSSASAALTAGAAAMYLQANPSASPAAVANALISTATTGVLLDLTAGSPDRLLYTGPAGSQPPPPPPTDAAPRASLSVTCRKTACTFDGSKSTDDHGIVRYSWNFGDGSSTATTGASTQHTFATAGTFTSTLTVVDAAGQTAQASVVVKLKGR